MCDISCLVFGLLWFYVLKPPFDVFIIISYDHILACIISDLIWCTAQLLKRSCPSHDGESNDTNTSADASAKWRNHIGRLIHRDDDLYKAATVHEQVKRRGKVLYVKLTSRLFAFTFLLPCLAWLHKLSDPLTTVDFYVCCVSRPIFWRDGLQRRSSAINATAPRNPQRQ